MEIANHSEQNSHVVCIDAHVHYHRCYDVERFLDSARANFRRATKLANVAEVVCCLLLADNFGQDTFSAFRAAERKKTIGGWSFQEVEDNTSQLAYNNGNPELILIKGRQIVTAENVEVLALATDQEFSDGLPIVETLQEVRGAGAIPVLPWGFGKWWFRRGTLVKQIVLSHQNDLLLGPCELFLGDNSGRAREYPDPNLFRVARAIGMRILPGSDPLPLASHTGNAGRYGFVLQGRFNVARPASCIRSLLRQTADQPATCGWRASLPRFCHDQLAMQFRKLQP